MKRIITLALLLFIAGSATEAYSRSWLKKLGKKVEEKAKQKVEEKAEKAVDKAFDKAEDAATDAVKGKDKKDKTADAADNANADGQVVAQDGGQQQKGQSLEMTYAKSDFVPGDEIIFEDLVDGEQLGEFPSMWDLKKGTAEVASVNGKKAITFTGQVTTIAPLMKDMLNYLPEKFTIEMDLIMAPDRECDSYYNLHFYNEQKHEIMETCIDNRVNHCVSWNYKSTSDERIEGSYGTEDLIKTKGWHHLAISFNKRAFKIYIDGIRIANFPNMQQPANFAFELFPMNGAKTNYVTNIRIAKGAVPLYDRMMSDGKFITYGITFDVGKSTIKPESMGEINRIVQLLTENPTLKFSVEGHTDATGNAASNQTLSEARSKAIVDKLVELGIAADRLTSVGKGQNSPIADNSTDEGRAKNRRVEFVKM